MYIFNMGSMEICPVLEPASSGQSKNCNKMVGLRPGRGMVADWFKYVVRMPHQGGVSSMV